MADRIRLPIPYGEAVSDLLKVPPPDKAKKGTRASKKGAKKTAAK